MMNQLLFWGVALLTTLSFIGLDLRLLSGNFKITYLLIPLMVFGVVRDNGRLGLVRVKNIGPPKKGAAEVNSPHYYKATVFVKGLIMGALLLLVAQIDSVIFFLLVGVLLLDFVGFRLLYKELIARSKALQEQLGGAQELLAVARECNGNCKARGMGSVFSDFNLNKLIQLMSLVTKAGIIALAISELIIYGFSPIYLVLPLYFYCLKEMVGGCIRKQDLINSLNYISQVEKRLLNRQQDVIP